MMPDGKTECECQGESLALCPRCLKDVPPIPDSAFTDPYNDPEDTFGAQAEHYGPWDEDED